MIITLDKSELQYHFTLASRVVSKHRTHPVLANVLCEIKDNQLILTGFDLQVGIRTAIALSCLSEPTKFTLPAVLTSQVLNKFPDGEITLNIKTEEDIVCEFTSSSGAKCLVRGMIADEFPAFPEIESEFFDFPVHHLKEGLFVCLSAASNEEAKQVLTGVHFLQIEDKLELAATDGHKLAVYRCEYQGNEFAETIPARSLNEILYLLKPAKEDVIKLRVDETQAEFCLGKITLTTRLLSGNYPKYSKLIPDKFTKKIQFTRSRLLKALQLVSVINPDYAIVKFSIDAEKQITLLSTDGKEVGNAQESISCQVEGDSIEIAFNCKYLLTGLNKITTDEVTLHLNEPTTPAVIRPVNGSNIDYLVMPVQIRD